MSLETIEINPDNDAEYSVIWLHGLGASANDFAPLIPQLGLPEDHRIRFVFPNAPLQPVTINAGMTMPAWYDILGFSEDSKQDAEGILASKNKISALIDAEIERGIASHNIMLAGFSQGGAMALFTGLSYAKPLAGLLILSSYLPIAEQAPEHFHSANQKTPVHFCHGEQDAVVLPAWGKAAHDLLHEQAYPVSFASYPMGHEVCWQQIADIKQWIADRVLQSATSR